MTFEQAARRLRLPLGFLLAALYLAFGPRPTPITLAVGGGLALVGLLIRAWAAGHIVKNDRLATTGPYAHTRNPLYFGSFLIAAGFAVAAHWSLLLIVIAFFALVYGPTIEKERSKISARFPDAYARWEQNVPAFVPRPMPWRDPMAAESERQGRAVKLHPLVVALAVTAGGALAGFLGILLAIPVCAATVVTMGQLRDAGLVGTRRTPDTVP